MSKPNVATLTKFRGTRLDPADDEALEEMAARRGCSVSDLVREALFSHFSLRGNATQSSPRLQGEDIPLAAVPAGGEASEVSQ